MFLRYFMVQLLAYVSDLGGFFFALYLISFNPISANVLGKLIACAVAFVAHRNLTFRVNHKENKKKQAFRYVALCMFNIPLSSIVLMAILSALPHVGLAKIIADAFCFILNYWLNKVFVFIPYRERSS